MPGLCSALSVLLCCLSAAPYGHLYCPSASLELTVPYVLPGLQLVLGGHDHHYEITPSRPHGTLVFKSGTDFREFSIIRLQLPPTPQGEASLHWHASAPCKRLLALVVGGWFGMQWCAGCSALSSLTGRHTVPCCLRTLMHSCIPANIHANLLCRTAYG